MALVSDRELDIGGYLDLRGQLLMRCLARGHLCGLDAPMSSLLCLPPCSSGLSTMSRRAESLEEDLVQPSQQLDHCDVD